MWWRVRTTLTDRPGALARISAACGENGLNILGLQIHPELGGFRDELVLETSGAWTAADLAVLVAAAGGREVSVGPSSCDELVDEPVRWLRAAQRVVAAPERRRAVTEELLGPDPSGAEQARATALGALLDSVDGATPGVASARRVVHEVLEDAVVSRVGERIVGTASLDAAGLVTVVVSPAWRRRGVGGAAFTRMAGVARHRGLDEVELLAPGGDEATLRMLDALGLRGLIRLRDGLLHVRVPLGGVRPLRPGPDAETTPTITS